MWQVPWTKAALTPLAAPVLACLLLTGPSFAQDITLQQNQNGFDLPGVTLPQGQDEVRAADGTSCASSIAGNGAYLDFGVIRGQTGRDGSANLATYGRFVVPLGKGPKRLDCSKLYELEVERLKLELELLKMGVSTQPTADPGNSFDSTVTAATTSSAGPAAPAPVVEALAPEMAGLNANARRLKATKKRAAWLADGWSNQGNSGGN